MFRFAWIILLSAHMTDALSLSALYIYVLWKVLYFILSEDDFEIMSKIYSLKLRLVLNHILNSQDFPYFRNLFFTLQLILNLKGLTLYPTHPRVSQKNPATSNEIIYCQNSNGLTLS